MIRVCFLAYNVHFLPSASGQAVLPREVINSFYRSIDASLITINSQSVFNRESCENIDERFNELIKRVKIIRVAEYEKYDKVIKEVIRDEKPDIIHIFDLPLRDLITVHRICKEVDSKLIYHTSIPPRRISRVFKALVLSRIVDGVIATSPYVFQQCLANLTRNARIIPPPIDTSLYKPLGESHSLLENKLTLLYIGPLDNKRFPIKPMINLLKNIKDVKLLMIIAPRFEDDRQRIQLLKEVAHVEGVEDNLHIVYGRIPIKEKIILFKSVDIVMFPFLKSYKGAVDPPITLLEAMSCGGLVLATSALSFPWIIRDGYNGFLCFDKNVVKKIKKISVMNDADKDVIRSNAVKTIKEYFSITKISGQLFQFYERILGR